VASLVPPEAQHPAVVLLPGTGGTACDWDEIAADLSRDRAVYGVDLRGHGRSQWPGVYSIDLMANDLAELLPRLAAPVDVVGHSLGGLVAARAVAQNPNLARRLVLEDVGLPHRRTPATPTRPEGDLDFDWAVVEQVRPEIDAPAAHWASTFSAIHVPTLAIAGGPTSFVPQAHVAELVALISNIHHVTIDAGHEVHAVEPELFLKAVHDFLDA
jgi:pimeloyl-ACP methyl ester carboxylesterase